MNDSIWIIIPHCQPKKIYSMTYGISLQLADSNSRDLFTNFFFNIQISINERLEVRKIFIKYYENSIYTLYKLMVRGLQFSELHTLIHSSLILYMQN